MASGAAWAKLQAKKPNWWGATGFELKNLTQGQYMVTAWHEKLGTVEQKLIIGAKETKNIAFVFKPRRSSGAASLQ